jgi:hypothetical protein
MISKLVKTALGPVYDKQTRKNSPWAYISKHFHHKQPLGLVLDRIFKQILKIANISKKNPK